jgi:glycosyltransferase involved in cell wall biosynthesis
MNREKPKLIFLWTYLEWGGAQIYMMAIMKEAKENFDITVMLPRQSSTGLIRFLQEIGVRMEFLDFYLDTSPAPSLKRKIQRQYRRIASEWKSLMTLRRHDLRRSILHIETAPWQSWIFLSLLSIIGANVFVTMHNALPSRPRWRVLLWRARLQIVSRLRGFHIFASNQDTKESLKGWVKEEFRQDMKVTYTCVDPVQISKARQAEFDKAAALVKHEIPAAKCIVLCVGQFIERKGKRTFLEAVKLVSTESDDISFVWVTQKPPDVEEIRLIDSYGVAERFRLVVSESIGPSRTDILKFFRIGDIFALPSFVEGLPISLLEAMAMGIPSISSAVNAIPEAIINGETGILIQPGDSRSLAREILSLAKDPVTRRILAEAGSKMALENFDERVASQIAIAEYKRCLYSRI